ncbi:MAG: hypothetical protein JXQ90_16485 [Cyclobacteriaceae bacterium]
MDVLVKGDQLIIVNDSKWSPIKGMLFGVIAGVVIGIVNESVEAAIGVFALVSVLGILMTLYERISLFKKILIDFDTKTIHAKNIFFNQVIRSYKVESFDKDRFVISHYDSSKKFFRKYYLSYEEHEKTRTLVLLLGRETLEEVSEFFKAQGVELKIQGQFIGDFLITDG